MHMLSSDRYLRQDINIDWRAGCATNKRYSKRLFGLFAKNQFNLTQIADRSKQFNL
jgi:hypothetical protein